ncbi:MAG: hypothetical protein ABI147_11115 [Acidobacteriaceae bacterium]
MKRILLPAALVLTLCGGLAVAQQQARQHEHDPHKMAMRLSHKLNLTPDQTARVEPILADRQQKVEALRSNTSLDPKSREDQMHAIHETSEQQLAGVLTPDQLQQMKSMHHGHHGHGQPPPPPAA